MGCTLRSVHLSVGCVRLTHVEMCHELCPLAVAMVSEEPDGCFMCKLRRSVVYAPVHLFSVRMHMLQRWQRRNIIIAEGCSTLDWSAADHCLLLTVYTSMFIVPFQFRRRSSVALSVHSLAPSIELCNGGSSCTQSCPPVASHMQFRPGRCYIWRACYHYHVDGGEIRIHDGGLLKVKLLCTAMASKRALYLVQVDKGPFG